MRSIHWIINSLENLYRNVRRASFTSKVNIDSGVSFSVFIPIQERTHTYTHEHINYSHVDFLNLQHDVPLHFM